MPNITELIVFKRWEWKSVLTQKNQYEVGGDKPSDTWTSFEGNEGRREKGRNSPEGKNSYWKQRQPTRLVQRLAGDQTCCLPIIHRPASLALKQWFKRKDCFPRGQRSKSYGQNKDMAEGKPIGEVAETFMERKRC